jgi:hypothetical protein
MFSGGLGQFAGFDKFRVEASAPLRAAKYADAERKKREDD